MFMRIKGSDSGVTSSANACIGVDANPNPEADGGGIKVFAWQNCGDELISSVEFAMSPNLARKLSIQLAKAAAKVEPYYGS